MPIYSLRHLLFSSFLCVSLTASPLWVAPVLAKAPQAQAELKQADVKPEIRVTDGVASFTLANGLDVVVIPDHRAPVVTQMVWYHVGSADEPAGKTGIAHFLEHLMFKGTKTYPAGEFSAKVAEIGGQENAFTSYDYTGYYQRVSPDALALVMGYEADRMHNLVLDKDAVDTERQVIMEERRMRTDSSPSAMLDENAASSIYYNHPYRNPVIGWRHEMETLNLDDAIAFYDRYYTPENATLVITGDVTPERVLELAQTTWAQVPSRAQPGERVRVIEPEKQADRSVVLHDARVTQPSFSKTWLVPSYANESRYPDAQKGDAAALDLLGEILGGSIRSRLYQNLMVKQDIAASVGANYSGGALDDGTFTLYGAPRGDVELASVEKQVQDELARLADEGVTQQELDKARSRFLKSMIYARDSQTGMAHIYGSAMATGRSVESVQKWPDEIRAVTTQQVQDVAKRYLIERNSVSSYLLPPDMTPQQARSIMQQAPVSQSGSAETQSGEGEVK